MIKIRKGLFETNSSSADVYNDYEEIPTQFNADIDLNIYFYLKENIEPKQIENDEEKIIQTFLEAYNEYVKTIKECIFTNISQKAVQLHIEDDYICFGICDLFYFDCDYEIERYDEYNGRVIFTLKSDPPVWKEEWNEGLEQAILKSYCNKYVSKFDEVVIDDYNYLEEWKKLEDNQFD